GTRELFVAPAIEDLEAYLNSSSSPAKSSLTGKERNRLSNLPRFSFPLGVQGVLPGGLHFYRLSLCNGCLSRYTGWPWSLRRGKKKNTQSEASPSPATFSSSSFHPAEKTGESSLHPRSPGVEEDSDGEKKKKESDAFISTDTLRLGWSDVIYSNAGDRQQWRHLLAVDGQVCELGVDTLRRLRLFRYLGRIDTNHEKVTAFTSKAKIA
ncbi:hypothetical protein CSUI_010314, partial [Cystoisospora suis]